MKTLWEKKKMLVTSIYSFSHNFSYPVTNRIHYFDNIYICRLQMLSIWTSLKNLFLVRSFFGKITLYLVSNKRAKMALDCLPETLRGSKPFYGGGGLFQERRILKNFYSASSPHSPEPCLLTDQNFVNSF